MDPRPSSSPVISDLVNQARSSLDTVLRHAQHSPQGTENFSSVNRKLVVSNEKADDASLHLPHLLNPLSGLQSNQAFNSIVGTLSIVKSTLSKFEEDYLPAVQSNNSELLPGRKQELSKYLSLLRESSIDRDVLHSLSSALAIAKRSCLPEGEYEFRDVISSLKKEATSPIHLSLLLIQAAAPPEMDCFHDLSARSVTLGGKCIIIDIEVSESTTAAVQHVSFTYSYLEQPPKHDEGIEALLTRCLRGLEHAGRERERSMKGFRTAVQSLMEIEPLIMTERLDCFDALRMLAEHFFGPTFTKPQTPVDLLRHPLPLLPTPSNPYLPLFYYATAPRLQNPELRALFPSESNDPTAPPLFPSELSENCFMLSVTVAKNDTKGVSNPSGLNSNDGSRTTSGMDLDSGDPDHQKPPDRDGLRFVAKLQPPVVVGKSTALRLLKVLQGGSAEEMSFDEKTMMEYHWPSEDKGQMPFVEDLLMSEPPYRDRVSPFDRKATFEKVLPGFSQPVRFTLAENVKREKAHVVSNLPFAEPGHLLRGLELIKQQQLINELFQNCFSGETLVSQGKPGGDLNELEDLDATLSDLLITPPEVLPASIRLNYSIPPSLFALFPLPDVAPASQPLVSMLIQSDSHKPGGLGVQLQFERHETNRAPGDLIDNKNQDLGEDVNLVEKVKEVLSRPEEVEKMEKVMAIGRNIGLFIRWLRRKTNAIKNGTESDKILSIAGGQNFVQQADPSTGMQPMEEMEHNTTVPVTDSEVQALALQKHLVDLATIGSAPMLSNPFMTSSTPFSMDHDHPTMGSLSDSATGLPTTFSLGDITSAALVSLAQNAGTAAGSFTQMDITTGVSMSEENQPRLLQPTENVGRPVPAPLSIPPLTSASRPAQNSSKTPTSLVFGYEDDDAGDDDDENENEAVASQLAPSGSSSALQPLPDHAGSPSRNTRSRSRGLSASSTQSRSRSPARTRQRSPSKDNGQDVSSPGRSLSKRSMSPGKGGDSPGEGEGRGSKRMKT